MKRAGQQQPEIASRLGISPPAVNLRLGVLLTKWNEMSAFEEDRTHAKWSGLSIASNFAFTRVKVAYQNIHDPSAVIRVHPALRWRPVCHDATARRERFIRRALDG